MRVDNVIEVQDDRTRLDFASRIRTRAAGRGARVIKRLAALCAGASIACLCFTQHAYAAGFSYVVSCASCQTTADFVAVAKRTAGVQGDGGLYLVTSLSAASSAYIQVTGRIITTGGEPHFTASAGTPVDANGNSLAGNTEAALESFYSVLDQVVFDASRNDPLLLILAPTAPIQSFINSNDVDVGNMINSLMTPSDTPDGTSVTVVFPDGTRATFVVTVNGSTRVWKWNGVAMQGNTPIDRSGRAQVPKTAGGGGGGEVNTPGFGRGSGTLFDLIGVGSCSYGGTITFPGGESLGSMTWGNC